MTAVRSFPPFQLYHLSPVHATCAQSNSTTNNFTMAITNSTTFYPRLKDQIKSSPKITSPDKRPTLTSIYEAKNITRAALITYHCTLSGADIHGHSWFMDGPTVWTIRSGEANFPTDPTPPTRPTTYDTPSIARYNDEFEAYKVYKSLTSQILDLFEHWFGADVFSQKHDLLNNRSGDLTAREAINHLESTFVTPELNREVNQLIRDIFTNITYSPSTYPLPISYFRAMIKCQLKAANVGRIISDQDVRLTPEDSMVLVERLLSPLIL